MSGERVLSRPQQLLERDRELAEVLAGIAAAARAEGTFLVLEGRSGMGKTSLLAEIRSRASTAGLAICSARGSELEGEFAFGVVRQLFEPAVLALGPDERAQILQGAAGLAEAVLATGGAPPPASQFATLHGLYWLAVNLAGRRPLLLSVDDAHWADAASLRWLAYLLNRLEGLPILVAIATRPPQSGPQGEVLTTILAHSQARIVTVGPLGEGSVATLVRTTLGDDPDPVFTAACLRATAGNPLGLSELLRELQGAGVPPTRAAAAGVETAAPDAITRRVQKDLRLLGEEAERLAGALAVIGDGTEVRLAGRLADLDLDPAADVAHDLLAADILASERPPRFAHPLLRAAVYDRLPAGFRQKLHRRAAEILRLENAEPEAVAAHLLRCDPGRSAETIECLRSAAPLARRRGVPEAAVAYLRRALAEDAGAAQRTAILAELGRAELAEGDPAAIGHLREALAGTTQRQLRATVMADLAAAIILHGDERASRDLFEQALEESRSGDEDAATRLECVVIGLSSGDPRLTLGRDRQETSSFDIHYPRLRELARSRRHSAELARTTLAYLLSWRDGNRGEALRWVAAGFRWRGFFQGSELDEAGVLWSTLALLGIDEVQRAADWSATVIREAAAEGHAMTVVSALAGKSYAECQLGRLADAEADGTAALEMSQHYYPFMTELIRARLADILSKRGRQAADDVIEETRIAPAMLGGGVEAEMLAIRGRLRWMRGRRERGVDDLRASGRLCELHGLRNPLVWSWRASLAEALAQNRTDEARPLAEENLANARRSGIQRAIGSALRTLATVDHDNAVDLLRASITTLEDAPAPLEQARTLLDLGGALRRQGHRVEARQPLREALELAARCGAMPLVDRAQAEATAAGARPRRPRLRGVDALTPSELRVARLAAEGRSNREIAEALFITMHTVADHLGSSYSKLDITSREQLAVALESATA